ncbi:hypothetical protein TVAGG3_0882810 [Trichomonas vaginalis G3]|uniref:hypothetical protein n=1 Tax=Trichomonas vaginalis (strain ATCC PRA-98 / G3) TaxID=412133 RepID=UPI0021E53C5B|nr:hypothetical protein TVAGG3_0882810 [Trichomonas vaginalis G3]KAI5502171.1 hypothetical protein TVAGG3_0882810 [Trichomonas vaginalis G3]
MNELYVFMNELKSMIFINEAFNDSFTVESLNSITELSLMKGTLQTVEFGSNAVVGWGVLII